MRTTAVLLNPDASGPLRYVFGPFYSGDFLEALTFHAIFAGWPGGTWSVCMVPSPDADHADQLESLSGGVALRFPTDQELIVPLNEFVQNDNRYLSLLVDMPFAPDAAPFLALVRLRPGRRGRNA